MKKILFLLTAALLIAGCSKDEEGKLQLSDKQVSLYSGETKQITVSENAVWGSRSEFVAKVSENGLITGNHVGKTIISATSENGEALCEVEVRAKYNTFMEPVLDFGASKSTIKSKESRQITKDSSDGLGYSGENSAVRGVAYLFSNDKLKSAALAINYPYAEQTANYLIERYQVVGENNGLYVFINNDMDKYNMGVTLSVENRYLLIIYVPQTPKGRSAQDNNYKEELKAILGI